MHAAMKGQPALWRLGDGAPPGKPHVALAPGADLPLLPVDLPEGLTGPARERVSRRVLAETLATPLERLEIRPYRRRGSGFARVLVADAAQLADWRRQLGDDCEGLVPDYASLPCLPGVWTIAADREDVVARLGAEDGFTAEPELAAALLEAAEKPAAVLRLGEECGPVDAAIAATGAPVFRDAGALAQAGHGQPLPWAEAVRGLDLRAPPGASIDRVRAALRMWTAPAAVAVLALGVWLADMVLETRQLRAQAATARAETEAMVRAHFLPAGPILDIRAQVTRALAEAAPQVAPSADPLVQFQRAAPHMAGDGVTLRTISYADATGLVAGVDLPDFAALDRLVANLRADGFPVEELESAAHQAGGVAARLRLSGAEG